MREEWEYWTAAAALVACSLLAWFAGIALRLQGLNLWIFRGGLTALGIAGMRAWWVRTGHSPTSSGSVTERAAGSQSTDKHQIGSLLDEAELVLKTAPSTKGRRLRDVPVLLILGDIGSGKTSAVVNAGLEAISLTGQLSEIGKVLPTSVANFWLTNGTVVIEVSAQLVSDPTNWARLLNRLQPRGWERLLGQETPPSRTAVVCYECDKLLREGASDSVSPAAAEFRAQLAGVAHAMGSRLPVYVLFTKIDRVPFFGDYAINLNVFEHLAAEQAFGTSLPPAKTVEAGVWAEGQVKRISDGFDDLFKSLCRWRLGLLSLESDPRSWPACYRFPREFRKLFERSPVTAFLVDLCRPLQTQVNPFLLGFYFSGFGKIVEAEGQTVGSPVNKSTAATGSSAATRIITAQEMKNLSHSPVPSSRPPTRRQWFFLSHLFNEILLRDQRAAPANGHNYKVQRWCRALLVCSMGLCLLLATGFIFSYYGSHQIAAEALRRANDGGATLAGVPRLAGLQALADLRQPLGRHFLFLGLGWGLDKRIELQAELHRIYRARFKTRLLLIVQEAMKDELSTLGEPTRSNADAKWTYETLEVYLITTSNPDKSAKPFLPAALLDRWKRAYPVSAAEETLIRSQFDYYADLQLREPFPIPVDANVVQSARAYLSRDVEQREYRRLLAEASAKSQKIDLTAGSSRPALVISSRIVEAAFTKQAWDYVQSTLKDPKHFFSMEEWVVPGAVVDPHSLGTALQSKYQDEYIATWRDFTKHASLAKVPTCDSASRALENLAGNRSQVMALLCTVSENTTLGPTNAAGEVEHAFQAVQSVIPAPCQSTLTKAAPEYVAALSRLSSSASEAAQNSTDTTKAGVADAVRNGREVVNRMPLPIDSVAQIDQEVKRMLASPIELGKACSASPGFSATPLCNEFRSKLAKKYPFDHKATNEATVDDLKAVFHPTDGAIASFLRENPQPSSPTASPRSGRDTLFVTSVANFGKALYSADSKQPHLQFSLKAVRSEEIRDLKLTIYGHTVGFDQDEETLNWPPATNPTGSLEVTFMDDTVLTQRLRHPGLWILSEFFSDAEFRKIGESSYDVFVPLSASLGSTQSKARARFQLNMRGGAPLIFSKEVLSQLRCVPQ